MSVLRQLLPSVFVLATGLLATPSSMCPVQHVTTEVTYEDDIRVGRLKEYFGDRNSPAHELARDFVAAADMYDLDWRLLPSISMMESSGGKRYIKNNILGWDSCRVGFPTIRDGIHFVAERLAVSDLYRGKDVDGILRTYNPYRSYRVRAKRIMNVLGPPDLGTAHGGTHTPAFRVASGTLPDASAGLIDSP